MACRIRPLGWMTVLLGIMVTGCGSTDGPLYSNLKQSRTLTAQAGKGLVLIYWLDGEGGVRIYANDQEITQIPPSRGAFLSYQADRGPLRISSGVTTGNLAKDLFLYHAVGAATGRKADRVVFEVMPGRTYYVRLQQGFWHEGMRLVSEEDAEREITDCHWQVNNSSSQNK